MDDPTPLRVLIVEDSEDDLALLLRELSQGGFDTASERVETASEMRAALAAGPWDVMLSDYSLPGFGAAQALALLQVTGQDIPFIVVSGTIGEETAVVMMRSGAADYVMKGRLARLAPAIRRELREAAVRRERRRVEVALREQQQENELMQERFRVFMQDVLFAVTDGKLQLCYTTQDLPDALADGRVEVPLWTQDALSALRRYSSEAALALGCTQERSEDLMTAASEAGMNALVHAGGAEGRIFRGKDKVQVWIEDQGQGIAVEHLPRATLEKGYTTAGTLGFGMKMILQTVDRIWLLTSLKGTTIVLEQFLDPCLPVWMV
jgi:anti-sigma regulatory factor (Ser/Thr protein kinase)/DNA-binding response OmpR family regulator